MNPRCAIVILAKLPRPGLAKTRLIPALGAEGAARLAAQMLRHTVAEAGRAGLAALELCVTPDLDHPMLAELHAQAGMAITLQCEGELGQRMAHAAARQLQQHGAVLLIGTDAPALDAVLLQRAAQALQQHDAVLAPAADGGYALIGLRALTPGLFTGIAWSTGEVLAQQRARFAELGWRHTELPTLHDIDEPADLVHLPAHWTGARIDALHHALAGTAWAAAPPDPLPDTGLAHWHLRLAGTGQLARVPKQSQLGLAAAEHLAYEAACFERAAGSGRTPALHAVLAPSPGLPRGALIVDAIRGRPAQLPADLPALVQALAAIHRLPPPSQRAPLLHPADPLRTLADEIDQQARHLDAAGIEPGTRAAIDAERRALRELLAQAERPPSTLISFDAHPGNFLVRSDGSAVLVDLEKARYGPPALDLAHATLYTSTTWDVSSHAVLSPEAVAEAYRLWLAALGPALAPPHWAVPLRRAMWLWSVTWCAKWRVLSRREAGGSGEDWSAERSDQRLVAHVQERVDHYLSAALVQRLREEFDQLEARLASLPNRSRNTASRFTA